MSVSNPQSSGSQDSIDSILRHTIGIAYGGKPPHNQNSPKKVVGYEEATKQLTAWHNTQLKQHTAAVANEARIDELKKVMAECETGDVSIWIYKWAKNRRWALSAKEEE